MVGGAATNPIQSDLINPERGTRAAVKRVWTVNWELGTGTGALLGLYIYIADLLQWLRSTVRGGLNETKMCFGSQGRGR